MMVRSSPDHNGANSNQENACPNGQKNPHHESPPLPFEVNVGGNQHQANADDDGQWSDSGKRDTDDSECDEKERHAQSDLAPHRHAPARFELLRSSIAQDWKWLWRWIGRRLRIGLWRFHFIDLE